MPLEGVDHKEADRQFSARAVVDDLLDEELDVVLLVARRHLSEEFEEIPQRASDDLGVTLLRFQLRDIDVRLDKLRFQFVPPPSQLTDPFH
ncbi:MAG: hypothetical protein A2992_06510 [Elusimicrobia bacterium RIFCSPLOWO2_01_FULL_59_12]|nr:MAG: hypothetical protein A2992_06510 [Elusimicrobia bacterium RIFCSPLOWO2_01_FULL_59_12]